MFLSSLPRSLPSWHIGYFFTMNGSAISQGNRDGERLSSSTVSSSDTIPLPEGGIMTISSGRSSDPAIVLRQLPVKYYTPHRYHDSFPVLHPHLIKRLSVPLLPNSCSLQSTTLHNSH